MDRIKTVRDVDLAGRRVFVRVDFNVPFGKDGKISDETRILGALPTIRHLLDQDAKVVLASHLGRPDGVPSAKYSLAPVAAALSGHLGVPVQFVDDCVGDKVRQTVDGLGAGSVILLENLRFHPGEEKNDPQFAAELAELADAYVNDAFGTAHRAHASTEGIAKLVPTRVAGLLMDRELEFLGTRTANPEKPFTVILGGAKVSDKIKVIDTLLDKCDSMLIGGAMAYTFALAKGLKTGASLTEPDKVELAKKALKKAADRGVNLLLPIDNVITDEIDFSAGTIGERKLVKGDIPEGWKGVDIGPESIAAFRDVLAASKTILWNGPMGVFEIPACAEGTFAVAEAVATAGATSIIGGGDSVKAINQSGFGDSVTFISTGGGASLEFLEGKTLPGVAVLDRMAD